MNKLAVIAIVSLLIEPRISAEPSRKGSIDAATLSCAGRPEQSCDPVGMAGVKCFSSPSKPIRFVSDEHFIRPNLVAPASNIPIRHLYFREDPSWVVSATWAENENSLLLTDVIHNSLLRYDLNGNLIERIQGDPGAAPALIAHTRDGGYVGNRQEKIAWFDRQLARVRTASIRGPNDSSYIDLVLGWLPLDKSMLFFGDMKNNEGKDIGSGLVRWEEGKMGCLDLLYRMDDRDPVARRFLQTAYPMIASVRNRGYMLIMEEKPYVLEVGVESRPLSAFPPGLKKRPPLPPLKTETAEQLYSMLAQSETVTSILGWGDNLFLLSRKPIKKGTQWLLWTLDPARDVVDQHPSLLPTNAEHIIVVPGKQRWAIIEKGHVKKLGQQAVTGAVIFAAPEVTHTPTSPRHVDLRPPSTSIAIPVSRK